MSTETQHHTPGPWRLNRQRVEYGPYVAGDGWCVAIVLRDPVEQEANARLIAAAPELLVALEQLVEAHDGAWWLILNPYDWEVARAAIAKATIPQAP